MARRSAQNPRYRKDAQVGSTRRSASSAKPKREAGEAGSSGGKASGRGGASKSAANMPYEPDTPEFKLWRKRWLWSLGGTVVLVGAALGLRTLEGQIAEAIAFAVLVSAYLALGFGLWIDWTKLRPMRKEWREQLAAGGRGKPGKAEKARDKKGDA